MASEMRAKELIMTKTVKDAAKQLPEKAQEQFLRAWDAANCMDLHNGNLDQYLAVIAQMLEAKTKQAGKIEKALGDALEITRKAMIECF